MRSVLAVFTMAMLQTWTAPVTDCHGKPAPVAHYEIQTWHGAMALQGTCPAIPPSELTPAGCCPLDDQGSVQPCSRWTPRVIVAPAMATSASWPDPQPGEVEVYTDVVAFDAFNNRSDQPCDP